MKRATIENVQRGPERILYLLDFVSAFLKGRYTQTVAFPLPGVGREERGQSKFLPPILMFADIIQKD